MKNTRAIALETDIEHIAKALQARHPRFRLMWLVGIETGLRVSDLLSLQVHHFTPGGSFTLTEGKTRKRKTCQLSPELWKQIHEFIKNHRLLSGHHLFYSSGKNKFNPISRQWATRIIAYEAKLRGLCYIGAHSMRKIYACKLYLSTGEIRAVQAQLNHQYPSTTLIYLADLLPGIGQSGKSDADLKPLPELPRAHPPDARRTVPLSRTVRGVISRFADWLFKRRKSIG